MINIIAADERYASLQLLSAQSTLQPMVQQRIVPFSMQFPVGISVANHFIPLHSILEPLSYFLGFRYFIWLRKGVGDPVSSPNRTWVIIAAIFGSLIGSRLVGGLENIPALANADNKWIYFYQNKTVLGGFLGGLAGVEFVKKLIGEKKASGDLFVYPLLLGLIIGRIGCFSMGIYEETYGIPTTLPWGMNFGDGQLRHPVCLYEILWLILLWRLIRYTSTRYSLANGAMFKLFMIGYLAFRFLLDFMKPHYTFSFGLSTIQVAALAGLLYYCRYITQPNWLLEKSNQKTDL